MELAFCSFYLYDFSSFEQLWKKFVEQIMTTVHCYMFGFTTIQYLGMIDEKKMDIDFKKNPS